MTKREYFKSQLLELRTMIVSHKAKGITTGPIIQGIHDRLERIFWKQ